MSAPINVGSLYPTRIPRSDKSVSREHAASPSSSQTPFRDVLQKNILKFSHHAEMRLQQRGFQINSDQMAQIQSAVQDAAAKGSKDSLIVMNNMALIVNVPNQTVVTAMDSGSMKHHVFTQIDSAVIIS